MFRFKNTAGYEFGVHFHHAQRGKNERGEKNPPRFTVCQIIRVEEDRHGTVPRRIVGSGIATPLTEFPVIARSPRAVKETRKKYGVRVKKTMKADDGTVVLVVRGDNFSRAEGRRVALTKALSFEGFNKQDRANAWDAYWTRLEEQRAKSLAAQEAKEAGNLDGTG